MTRDFKFETLQLHAGQVVDPATKSRAVPIYQTTSFVFDDTQEGADLFALRKPGNIYTRITNPTTAAFVERIAALEGGVGALATASGMAAVTYTILALAHAGDHVVAASTIYGGTFNLLKETLPRYGITTTFVDVDNLEEVEAAINELNEKGYVYEKDGALWFETTKFGDDKDRVLRKQDGSLTYLVPDIAYHNDKCQRGFDMLVDFFGADHHGYIPRLKASMTALGNDADKLHVDIIQMVRLVSNGEEMKMSKRLGNATTINELCDKVGVDAARYFFVQRALDSHLDFDIELATKKSNENPVYYAQYAHARMCSIQKQAQDIELATSFEDLTNEKEIELMKSLQEFNKVIVETAQSRQVHKMCHYIQNLASKFHSFYNACKVVDRDNLELSAQRLALVKATQIVLANALECIGVEAVESM